MKSITILMTLVLSMGAMASTSTVQVTQPVSRTTGGTTGTTVVPAQDATTAAQVGTQSTTSGTTLETSTNTNGKTTKQILDERTRSPGANTVNSGQVETDVNGARVRGTGRDVRPVRTRPGTGATTIPYTEQSH